MGDGVYDVYGRFCQYSSGVVASIVLVSPGLDCPGVSLAEVCATCLRCPLW